MIYIKIYSILVVLALTIASYPLCASPPDWEVEAQNYQYSANVIAMANIDGLPSLSIGDQIGFFVGDELRGSSQPVPAGGQIFHFATVYANEPLGETMTIKVYHALNDQIYTAFTTYTFTFQEVLGNFEAPFKILVRTDGDFPISIRDIPIQRTLQTYPFASIDLSLYLEQTDTDPVVWNAVDHPFLNTTINGSILQISVNDPNWFGSTNLTISAQELGLNGYFASKVITFEAEQAFPGPLWDVFVGESVHPGQPFTNILLDDFEIQHLGNCLQYSLQPVLEVPQTPVPPPNWQVNATSTPGSMAIVAQVQFTPTFFFNHPNDRLGAFINEEVRGVAEPIIINEQSYYFLLVYNETPNAIINLKFYSATYQQIFELPYTILYNGLEGLGTVDAPELLDFSPFVFNIANNSATQINVQDQNWQGYQSYVFTVVDCDYPDLLLDQTEVTYCVGDDNDDDGFCNFIDSYPNDRCMPDHYPPELKIINEQAANINNLQAVSREADQGDCLKSLIWQLNVDELCEVPLIEIQITCENAEVLPSASAILESTGVDNATFNLYVQASVGINKLLIIATDSDGNTSRFECQIDVADTQAPAPVCQFAQVWLAPEGQGELLPEEVLNAASSFDNCSIEYLSVSKSDYDCNDLGNNTVILTAIDKAGNSSSCNASISVTTSGELLQNWQSINIGQVTVGNTYFFDPCTETTVENGEYTLVGSGNNTSSSTTDNIAFASQTICGDGLITAKIESVSPNGYGGLMIRESNAPGAKQAAVFSNQTNILRHETRYSSNAPKQINSFFKPAPFWLRMERSGSWIFSYYSTNGITFQYVHGVFVPMQECIEMGLSSFTYLPFSQTEVVFSFVHIQGENGLNEEEPIVLANNKFVEANWPVRLFPNPSSHTINLEFDKPISQHTELLLINQLGQIIDRKY